MEIKPKLICINVDYRDTKPDEFSEPPIKKEFNKSLGLHPLSSIKSINICYELNEGHRLNLKIKQGNSQHKWDVYERDEFNFSFPYKDEKDFIDTFEKRLKQELKKHELKEYYKKHPYSFLPPDHDAKISMG